MVFVEYSPEGVSGYFEVLNNIVLEGIEYDGVTLTDNWPAEDFYIMLENDTFPFISEVSFYYFQILILHQELLRFVNSMSI